MKSIAIAVCLSLTVLVAACRTLIEGDGVLREAYVSKVPLNLRPGEIHIVPDEKLILCETAGPYHYFLSYDIGLRPERQRQYEVRRLALSADGKTGAGFAGKGLHVVVVPEMSLLHHIPKPASAILPAPWVGPLPAGDGWVVSSGDPKGPNVWAVTGERPQFGTSGRSELSSQIRARALDPKTGHLIITGHGNKLEIFDLAEMKSLAVLELPCSQVSTGIAAGDGVAWVGTVEGTVIPVDLENRTVGEAFKFGAGPGDVDLALSPSGKHLAVGAQDRRDTNEPFPTSLRVFRVDGMTLKAIAKGFLNAHGSFADIEILEKAKLVVYTCGGGLYGWYFAEKR
jgi:hypothetical protein